MILGLSAAAVIPAMRYAVLLIYRRDDGLAAEAVELRADLAAARVVGKDAVIPALERTERKENQAGQAAAARLAERLFPATKTHPPTRLRIEVVRADAQVCDPFDVAQRALSTV